MRADARRGLTLVELAVAIVLLAGVLGAPALLLLSGSRAYAVESASNETTHALREGLNTIASRLTTAVSGTVLPPANVSSWIEFNRSVGFQAATNAPLLGPTERIQFEYSLTDPDDGLDNDGNGLVDDGRVVWIENPLAVNERRVLLVDWVPEAQAGEILGNGLDDNGNGLVDEMGLAFDPQGGRVRVLLTVQRPGPDGAMITKSLERTVSLRN